LLPINSYGKIGLLEPPVPTEPQTVVSSLLNTPEMTANSIIKSAQSNAHLYWMMGMKKQFLLPQRCLLGNF